MSDAVTATGGDTEGTTDWLNEMGLDVATMMRLRIQQGESPGVGCKIPLVTSKDIPVQMRGFCSCRVDVEFWPKDALCGLQHHQGPATKPPRAPDAPGAGGCAFGLPGAGFSNAVR
jgi:hypothetical protein